MIKELNRRNEKERERNAMKDYKRRVKELQTGYVEAQTPPKTQVKPLNAGLAATDAKLENNDDGINKSQKSNNLRSQSPQSMMVRSSPQPTSSMKSPPNKEAPLEQKLL